MFSRCFQLVDIFYLGKCSSQWYESLIQSVDIESFHSDIQASSLCDNNQLHTAEDLDAYAREYITTLSALLDRHAPLKTRKRVTRPVVPWYNETIDSAKRERKKAERKWRKTKATDDLLDFKSKRNHATYLMNKARRDFYSEFMDENGADQRKLFSAANKLLGMKKDELFAEHLDKTVVANDIGRYFVRKVESIRSEIEAKPISQSERDLVPPDKPVVNKNAKLRSFRKLSEQEIYDLIQKSAKKSCALDPLPTTLVCDSLEVLLPVITKLVNASLTTAHFPTEWKEAIVNPLLKKSAKEVTNKNLRPVCNLQFVSKITERAVFDQVYSHITDNELFPMLQSAYRKGHSTETALLRVVNDILSSMNKQHVSILVLLDLSAAFDTVDHAILLRRLETSFGITDAALAWFSSYLSGRSQRVSVDGERSDSYPLPYGVPQGSCLGPLLFSTYASKLFDVIKLYLPSVHAFADDTQLYLSFKPDNSHSEAEAIYAVEQCIRAIRAWMNTDKLKLNDDKTEIMLIGTRQQLNKVNLDTLTVGDTSVSTANEARNLGVWFDSQLNFNAHIRKTCSLSFGTLYKIRCIRKYLTFKSAQTLVLALVIGRLDYCNSLLYGLPASYINMLQRVQNAAARLISNTPRFGHISPVMKDLHWLPVKYRIMFKIVVFTFKAIHGSAPTYISQLIRLKPKSTYMLRSNTKHFLLDQPRKMKKTTGDRAFLAAAPTLWNALPDDLRTLDNLKSFKSQLKTHFFKLAYNLCS